MADRISSRGQEGFAGSIVNRRIRPASLVWRFMKRKPLGGLGLILVSFFIAVAIFSPWLAPYNPATTVFNQRLLPPSSTHWFGTDMLGRDMASRTIIGSRISIAIGLLAMAGATIGGAALGVTSGYFGGKFDLFTQRIIDSLTAFPALLMALALVAAFGNSYLNVVWALVIVFTPRVTRIVRSASMSVKQMPYVEAARALGASSLRIMLRHILPNAFASLIVVSSGLIGAAILTEASLSFLGLGTPGMLSWGGLLNGNVMRFFQQAPWIVLFPGFALTLLVFGVNVLADSMRDVLDPRMRGRSGL